MFKLIGFLLALFSTMVGFGIFNKPVKQEEKVVKAVVVIFFVANTAWIINVLLGG